jgi:hypothetical protein
VVVKIIHALVSEFGEMFFSDIGTRAAVRVLTPPPEKKNRKPSPSRQMNIKSSSISIVTAHPGS